MKLHNSTTQQLPTRISFTKRILDNLPLPIEANKQITYHDKTKPGLKLMVRSGGTKTFFVYRKIQGKPERITIGRYPNTTIEQARRQADVLNAKVSQGINPNDEKRLLRAEMTFKELFDYYLKHHAIHHKKTWKEDMRQFNSFLNDWKNRKLSSFTYQQIQKRHIDIGENHGRYAANRLLALLRTIFNKAIQWGWNHPNPTSGIKKFKEESRERFIQADELPRFFAALNEDENQVARDFFIMCLLTGARKSNVLTMRWEQINFSNNTWTIPTTKNGDAHTIPLVDAALEILIARQQTQNDNPWVFPGPGKEGHFAEPKRAWDRIRQRSGMNDLRIHDLRRSLGSWQASTGANLSIIGKTLAHKSVSTTAIYARLSIGPVREAIEKATDAMLLASQEHASKKVIA
jgi:integrase